MKIVIDIPENVYEAAMFFKDSTEMDSENSVIKIPLKVLINGIPLSDGAEILTKEAYSDLCMRAGM